MSAGVIEVLGRGRIVGRVAHGRGPSRGGLSRSERVLLAWASSGFPLLLSPRLQAHRERQGSHGEKTHSASHGAILAPAAYPKRWPFRASARGGARAAPYATTACATRHASGGPRAFLPNARAVAPAAMKTTRPVTVTGSSISERLESLGCQRHTGQPDRFHLHPEKNECLKRYPRFWFSG